MVRDLVKQYADFKEIYVTRAGCTISSHCGPQYPWRPLHDQQLIGDSPPEALRVRNG